MTFLQKAKKSLSEDSPFFKAEVLKEYRFILESGRLLKPEDRMYDEKMPKWEFTIMDPVTGKKKIWTTSPGVVRDMVDQGIDEGDTFSVVKTGEVGKGKKYWRVQKINSASPLNFPTEQTLQGPPPTLNEETNIDDDVTPDDEEIPTEAIPF